MTGSATVGVFLQEGMCEEKVCQGTRTFGWLVGIVWRNARMLFARVEWRTFSLSLLEGLPVISIAVWDVCECDG